MEMVTTILAIFLASFVGDILASSGHDSASPHPCVHVHRSASQKILRYASYRTVLSEHASSSSHPSDDAPHPDSHLAEKHPTMMLDLDETCLFGNDGNDLGIALQCMGESKYLHKLYQLLVNPALRAAYDVFRNSSHCGCGLVVPRVVIYTSRSALLFYASEFRPKPVALRHLFLSWSAV